MNALIKAKAWELGFGWLRRSIRFAWWLDPFFSVPVMELELCFFFSFFCTAKTRPWPWGSFLHPPKFRTICSQKCNRWKRAIKKESVPGETLCGPFAKNFPFSQTHCNLKKGEKEENKCQFLFFLLRLKGISQTRIGNEFPLLSSLIHFKPIEWIFVSP